jgi:hypothetical protein
MRLMGFHDFDLDGNEEDLDYERPPRSGAPSRTNPGRYDNIAELRTSAREDELNMPANDGGMNLEQLEEMMLREVTLLLQSISFYSRLFVSR